MPETAASALLLVIGAIGYDLSLRPYLIAQRELGAGRTGSIFACGPFIGALVAVAIGEPAPGAATWVAGGLCTAAIYLHLSERHRHLHAHEAVEHEHAHRHDDGHHAHVHEPNVVGSHSHIHRHEAIEHEHEHALDLHHQHMHKDR